MTKPKRRKKSERQVLVEDCDDLCRKIVRSRDKERCVICGSTNRLQVAHIFSKGAHPSMRFEIDNLLLTCYHCHHHFLHKAPCEARDWIKQYLGEEKFERLYLMANQSGNKIDIKLIKIYLENYDKH